MISYEYYYLLRSKSNCIQLCLFSIKCTLDNISNFHCTFKEYLNATSVPALIRAQTATGTAFALFTGMLHV